MASTPAAQPNALSEDGFGRRGILNGVFLESDMAFFIGAGLFGLWSSRFRATRGTDDRTAIDFLPVQALVRLAVIHLSVAARQGSRAADRQGYFESAAPYNLPILLVTFHDATAGKLSRSGEVAPWFRRSPTPNGVRRTTSPPRADQWNVFMNGK